NKPKRPIKTTLLREWLAAAAGIPLWLFEESYYVVGDLAETLTLLAPAQPRKATGSPSLKSIFEVLVKLQQCDVYEQKTIVNTYWNTLAGTELFLFNKMLTGGLRIGVSRKLVINALAAHLGQDGATVAHQLMGKWDPLQTRFSELFPHPGIAVAHHIPYPFFLAYPLAQPPDELGDIRDWLLEKKLDGIRGQVIRRNGALYIWSRGEDLLTDKFPEFGPLNPHLPDGSVIDGEIIPWKDGRPLPFSLMQTRIGRKNLSPKILREAPLVMVCYDLLEYRGRDIRQEPLAMRRAWLAELIDSPPLRSILLLSEELIFDNWQTAAGFRKRAREFYCEGLMLKNRQSAYGVGRKKGDWWKWKTDPLSIDAVMIYAQSGHGRR